MCCKKQSDGQAGVVEGGGFPCKISWTSAKMYQSYFQCDIHRETCFTVPLCKQDWKLFSHNVADKIPR